MCEYDVYFFIHSIDLLNFKFGIIILIVDQVDDITFKSLLINLFHNILI